MKNLIGLLILIISSQSWAHMNHQQTSYTIDFSAEIDAIVKVEFRDQLDSRIDNRFKLSFINSKTQKKFTPKFYVKPYLWMVMPNGHEHGSSPIMLDTIDQTEKEYLYYNVFFVMPGKWQFHVRLEDQDCKYFDANYDQDKNVCYLDKMIELMIPGAGMGHGQH